MWFVYDQISKLNIQFEPCSSFDNWIIVIILKGLAEESPKRLFTSSSSKFFLSRTLSASLSFQTFTITRLRRRQKGDKKIGPINLWNERKADNVRERRDFEEVKVKSHLGLSSAQPFNYYTYRVNYCSYEILIGNTWW